jgi:hypothetical protein
MNPFEAAAKNGRVPKISATMVEKQKPEERNLITTEEPAG